MHSPAASVPPPPFLPPTFPPSLTVTSQAQVSPFPALTFSLFSLKMRLTSFCVWLLFLCGTPVDSGKVNLLDYSGFGPCDVTLTPEEPCDQEGDEINCPYLFNVPPLTVHLPKQLRELERIMEELQMLKDNVDELRRMCADCTVRQTGRECDRESETMNEGKNRKEDGGNWLNAGSLKNFSLEHGTKRVKSENGSDGYSEREAEKIILEEENKGGAEGQNTTGDMNEEIRGDRKQGVSITGTGHTQRAKVQDKWTAKTANGGNGKLVDFVIKSTDEKNRWGKTDDRGNDMNGKENSRDREYMLENGEESIVTGDLKNLEKTHPHLGHDRTKEMELKTQTKETGSSKVINMSNFHDEHTDKRQQQHVEERKKKMEKGIIVERGNEKLRGASKKGEEEKKETGQESKAKGEELVQGAQTDGGSGLASSKDTARTNYASKGQTSSISAEGPSHESADSNAALSYVSSHGFPAFSSLTPSFPRVNKGLTTTAAGLQIQTTDLSATFIAQPGFTATGRPTTARLNTGQQSFTGPHRVVRPTMATTTTTMGPTIATLPGVSQHDSTVKMNINSHTKTGVNLLSTNPKIKTTKINNTRRPAQGPSSDKKTKYDQKQKPPYHKPLTKPRLKGSQLFQGLKASQRTGILPADLNLKNTQIVKKNPTNQNHPNIQNPKSPPKLPVQRSMSHQRHRPVNVNNPEKHLPIGQKPESTQITNVTQNEKISNSEKKTVHLLKMEQKWNQPPEINQGLRDIEGQSENKQTTNFTPQSFQEADAELLENADGRPLAETKNVSSEQKVTPSPIPIKLLIQSQTTNLSPDVNFNPEKMSEINHQGPEPELQSGSNVKTELQQTDPEEGRGTPQQNQTPRFSSTHMSERNPGAESSNTPFSKQRSHTRPTDMPQVERSKPSTPLKPISKTDTDSDPLQIARATLDPFQPSQTSTLPAPGSAKSFAGVNIDPGKTEVSSNEVATQDSNTLSSLEGGAKPHLNTPPEDFMLSPDGRKISDLKPQTSAPTPSIQAATTSHRVTLGLLPNDFGESVLLYSTPKTDGESKHGREDKQVWLSKPDKGSDSHALPTDQTQTPQRTSEQLITGNRKPHQKPTPPILRPTGGVTDPLPESDETSSTEKSNPGFTAADIHRGETDHKAVGWSVSATQQPENTPRLPPKLLHVMTPVTEIMENSVNSEAGSKPVLPDPNPDSRKKFPQIKPKPAPAPKTGLSQSDPDLTSDPEAEHNLEPDKTSHINRGIKPPLPDLTPNPTMKPVPDGAPRAENDRNPSPLPRHRSPSTPTAEPRATSAHRSTPSFPLKSGSKPKTQLDLSHVTKETSGPFQNSQMILPPSSGPVKLLDDANNSRGDTEVSTIKMTTMDLKSSSSHYGRANPHLHTIPGDVTVNPNSRIMSRQKSQTTAAPLSIQVSDRPNRIIPRILSSVPPSNSPTEPKRAANVDSKLHHNQEETTKSQIYDSNKVMNAIPSSSSTDLRSTNPANSGPQPLAPDVSTDGARELRVKINQVAAFFNNSQSTSGRHPERHSAEHPEDKQRGSGPDGMSSKLLTRIPSKGKTGSSIFLLK